MIEKLVEEGAKTIKKSQKEVITKLKTMAMQAGAGKNKLLLEQIEYLKEAYGLKEEDL